MNSGNETGDLLYRPAVGMMILNAENKIFLGQSLDKRNWFMPQGGIEPHEDADQAMLREMEEEVGTRNVEIIAKSKSWYKYDLPAETAVRLFDGKYKGQKQMWYALRFRGKDEDVDVMNTAEPEFCSWKWVEKADLLGLITHFKKEIYARVLDELWSYVEHSKS